MYRGKLRGYIVSLVNFNTSYMSSGLFNQSLYTTSFNFTPNSQTSLASYNFTNFTNKLLNSMNNINLNFRTETKNGVNKTLSTSSLMTVKWEVLLTLLRDGRSCGGIDWSTGQPATMKSNRKMLSSTPGTA